MRQPNLFFIGGMRCGSTTIHHMLGQHPDIFMSEVKEPMYYFAHGLRQRAAHDSSLSAPAKRATEAGKYRIPDSYYSLFENVKDQRYIGESSHYIYHPLVIPHILQDAPDARFILSIRNPVERIFSEYSFYLRTGRVQEDFDAYIHALDSDGEHSRLNKGMIAHRLKRFLDEAGADAVYVLRFDSLKQDPAGTMNQIYAWLGLRPFEVQKVHTQQSGKVKDVPLLKSLVNEKRKRHWLKRVLPKRWKLALRSKLYEVSLEKARMSAETEAFLYRYYAQEVEELESLTGMDLRHWKRN